MIPDRVYDIILAARGLYYMRVSSACVDAINNKLSMQANWAVKMDVIWLCWLQLTYVKTMRVSFIRMGDT